ncbi:MAG: TraM recognition domain-containing protein [Bacteroidota bacterium]
MSAIHLVDRRFCTIHAIACPGSVNSFLLSRRLHFILVLIICPFQAVAGCGSLFLFHPNDDCMGLFSRKPLPEDSWLPLEEYDKPEYYDEEGNFIGLYPEESPLPEEPPPEESPPDNKLPQPPSLEELHRIFDLNRTIYRFNDIHDFTIRDACEGVQIFGGTGSGKTSGSGAHLARAYLQAGFGGLVLCAKKDEAATWLRYAAETGRSDDVMIMDETDRYRFPFLRYEVKRQGAGAGFTSNMVRLFMTVHEAISRNKTGGGGSEAFWYQSMEELMQNAIDLSVLANGDVSLPDIYEIIRTAPQKPGQMEDDSWGDDSLCLHLILLGHTKFDDMSFSEQLDWEETVQYWKHDFPGIDEKTRSGIVKTFTSMASKLLRRPFRTLFSEKPVRKEQVIVPEYTHHGMIQIINLPVKEFGDAGKAAAIIYKFIWQQAAERRDVTKNPRPVFLWCDESQNFVSDYDMHFQATARSTRGCTVYLAQNVNQYYTEIGKRDNRSWVASLIGNMQTRILHANNDPDTNTQAADTIGKSWHYRRSLNKTTGAENASAGMSVSESYDYDVIPQRFSQLARGGPAHDFQVEGVLFMSGRTWPPSEDEEAEDFGKNALLTTFKQFNV